MVIYRNYKYETLQEAKKSAEMAEYFLPHVTYRLELPSGNSVNISISKLWADEDVTQEDIDKSARQFIDTMIGSDNDECV